MMRCPFEKTSTTESLAVEKAGRSRELFPRSSSESRRAIESARWTESRGHDAGVDRLDFHAVTPPEQPAPLCRSHVGQQQDGQERHQVFPVFLHAFYRVGKVYSNKIAKFAKYKSTTNFKDFKKET